ncbi:MAG: hypothetical protein K2X00_08365 [Nitrospiraceae bacterium]|nr:hypothetical protein [Nitrospiraceae bacterium]OQW65728.1 MAG: hypothetical protein BVN29_08895 [Nitrospira sp. ST-bin5]
MIIQCNIDCLVRVNDENEIVFKDQEPIVLPALYAVPVLIKHHENVEVISSVVPAPSCEVVWTDARGNSRLGHVLYRVSYLDELWLLIQTDGVGRLVRSSDIIGVNPKPLFRLACTAMEAIGTQEAERMAANIVMTLLDLDPTS